MTNPLNAIAKVAIDSISSNEIIDGIKNNINDNIDAVQEHAFGLVPGELTNSSDIMPAASVEFNNFNSFEPEQSIIVIDVFKQAMDPFSDYNYRSFYNRNLEGRYSSYSYSRRSEKAAFKRQSNSYMNTIFGSNFNSPNIRINQNSGTFQKNVADMRTQLEEAMKSDNIGTRKYAQKVMERLNLAEEKQEYETRKNIEEKEQNTGLTFYSKNNIDVKDDKNNNFFLNPDTKINDNKLDDKDNKTKLDDEDTKSKKSDDDNEKEEYNPFNLSSNQRDLTKIKERILFT